ARSAGTVCSRSSFVSQIMSFPPPLRSGFSVSARLADCTLAGWPAPARAALPAVSMGDEAVGRMSRDPIKGHAALPTESQGRGGIMCTLLRPVKLHACQAHLAPRPAVEASGSKLVPAGPTTFRRQGTELQPLAAATARTLGAERGSPASGDERATADQIRGKRVARAAGRVLRSRWASGPKSRKATR